MVVADIGAIFRIAVRSCMLTMVEAIRIQSTGKRARDLECWSKPYDKCVNSWKRKAAGSFACVSCGIRTGLSLGRRLRYCPSCVMILVPRVNYTAARASGVSRGALMRLRDTRTYYAVYTLYRISDLPACHGKLLERAFRVPETKGAALFKYSPRSMSAS